MLSRDGCSATTLLRCFDCSHYHIFSYFLWLGIFHIETLVHCLLFFLCSSETSLTLISRCLLLSSRQQWAFPFAFSSGSTNAVLSVTPAVSCPPSSRRPSQQPLGALMQTHPCLSPTGKPPSEGGASAAISQVEVNSDTPHPAGHALAQYAAGFPWYKGIILIHT